MLEEPEVQYLMLEQLKLLRTDVQGVKVEVSGVKFEISALKTGLAGVKAEVAGVRSEVVEVREAVGVTNQRLGIVEETLRDLAAQMPLLARFVRNVGDRYDHELDEVKARLTRVEAKIEG